MARLYNFSAGPATLPEEVLNQVRDELLDYDGTGMSIMESSHRGKPYAAVHAEAVANYSKLLGLGDDYAVLFLAGGATGQFAMLPMNFLGAGQTADYVNSGAWAGKAIKEAKTVGQVNVAADTSTDSPTRMPAHDELKLTDDAAYLHICSNETISGAQLKTFPQSTAPLIVDMSSDILSRPVDYSQFSMIYAGAQKNLGPAGVALVVIRKELAETGNQKIPSIFRYSNQIANDSLVNTPPTFSIYIMSLVSRWLLKEGPENVYARNVEKAGWLYESIDADDFYTGAAQLDCRSDMNVTFTTPSAELDAMMIAEAGEAGFSGLKGHRSVGGLRASIYNAMPAEGVKALADFMVDFRQRKG